MTHAEAIAYLRSADPGAIRVRTGTPLYAIAAALGVSRQAVWTWETRRVRPKGGMAQRYCRIIQGLARHLEITEEVRGG